MVTSDPGLHTGALRGARSFYTKALSETERLSLAEAMQVEGLDEEIALLRLRLAQVVTEHPEELDLMFKGAAMLARLVATRYNLSKFDAADLEEAIQRAARNLNEMDPEAADDGVR